MTARIHFEDNVFVLQSQIQTLRHSLILDIDSQYFLDKILEDFFFIDQTLLHLYRTLLDNEYLVKRKEYLRSLLHCKQEFLTLAHGLIQGQFPFSHHCKPFMGKILQSIQREEKDYEEIRRVFLDEEEQDDSETGLSSAEYEFLLGATYTNEG
ncbi:MAG: hypothetical protein GW949_09930 [Spirochaetales bacterium]|nr:hypothetical protein [Spirochaetales bacterium]